MATTRRARRKHAKVTNQARNKSKRLVKEGVKTAEQGMHGVIKPMDWGQDIGTKRPDKRTRAKKMIEGGKKIRQSAQIDRTLRGPRKIKRKGSTARDY